MNTDQEDIEIGADIEPDEPTRSGHIKSSRKAFSKLAVELTDDELNSSGVQKMLLAEISRLESSVLHSEGFRDKYHAAEKYRAVLEEKGKTFLFSEILYSVSLTIGAVILGLSPSIKTSTVSPVIVGAIGAALIIGAVVAKVVKK